MNSDILTILKFDTHVDLQHLKYLKSVVGNEPPKFFARFLIFSMGLLNRSFPLVYRQFNKKLNIKGNESFRPKKNHKNGHKFLVARVMTHNAVSEKIDF
jgi:hypothetical protein